MSVVHRGAKQMVTCACGNRIVATLRMTGTVRCSRCRRTVNAQRAEIKRKEMARGQR